MKKIFLSLTLFITLILTNIGASAENVLSYGSNDKEVITIQKILSNNGYYSNGLTGFYGPYTKKAVSKLQSDFGLKSDGVVGEKTRDLLYGYSISKSYTYEDVYWLSRLIEAEASGESYYGKLAVGNCVLSRVLSDEFPNNVVKVIFDNTYAVQFQPTSNGRIYNQPSNDSILAAISALEGVWYVDNCLYFFNPKISTSTWISNNRTYYTTIGKHDFYM